MARPPVDLPYSIALLSAALPEWARNVLFFNPAVVYISLTSYGRG